jgi:hypothetical protein
MGARGLGLKYMRGRLIFFKNILLARALEAPGAAP